MAFVAFVVGVLAQQREGCQIMIEEDRVLPIDFGVTGCALATQRTFMRVVVQMARVAARC